MKGTKYEAPHYAFPYTLLLMCLKYKYSPQNPVLEH